MSFTASPTVRRDGFASAAPPDRTITVDLSESPETTAVKINDDGSVEIRPMRPKAAGPDKFNANLAEMVDEGMALSALVEEVAEGVEADIQSRREFIELLEAHGFHRVSTDADVVIAGNPHIPDLGAARAISAYFEAVPR